MKEVLEPLTRVSGVRQVAIVSSDGVPVVVLDRASRSGDFIDRSFGQSGKPGAQRIDPSSFGALAAGWAEELARAVAPMAWDAPWRIALVASQGTLVVQQGPGAMVLVVLEVGTPPEALAIPLDGTVARMERLLKSLGRHAEAQDAPSLVDDRFDYDAPAAVRLDSQDQPGGATGAAGQTHLPHPYGDIAQDH
ncbi:MAG: hypothetical protein R3F49_03730 [Planctomycetota bacterium]